MSTAHVYEPIDTESQPSTIHSNDVSINSKLYVAICMLGFLSLCLVTLNVPYSSNTRGGISLLKKTSVSTTAPNFVFLFADDLSWNSFYQDYDLTFATPRLTALADDGIFMSKYYSQVRFIGPVVLSSFLRC